MRLKAGTTHDETEELESFQRRKLSVVIKHWVELSAAALLALATIATAWSGYQSALWGSDERTHETNAAAALIQAGLSSNFAEQRSSAHTALFGHWAALPVTNSSPGFLFAHFPEPLLAAATAWLETDPLTNLDAPATPLEMEEYRLSETEDAARWQTIATAQTASVDRSGEISDRHPLFTSSSRSCSFSEA